VGLFGLLEFCEVFLFFCVIQVKSIFECVSSYGCNVRALISLRPTLPSRIWAGIAFSTKSFMTMIDLHEQMLQYG
jgi:hypothetical protein